MVSTKEKIIDQILESEDAEMMEAIDAILKLFAKDGEEFPLSPSLEERIEEGKRQVAKGEVKESRKMWKEVDQWLENQ